MAFVDVIRRKWITRNPLLILLLGFGSSILGVFTAYIIFPENVGLMGLAFASLIMQPFLAKLLSYEKKQKFREKRFSLRQLFKDHSQTFSTILLLFFGVLLAYSMMYLYSNEIRVKELFGSQLAPYTDLSGDARSASGCGIGMDCFTQYVWNNTVVMMVVLLLSIFYGAGAMLFLAWNASVWGTVFAFIAKEASSFSGGAKIAAFSALFIKVFPHTLLEASAYFLAVISGVVISKALVTEKSHSERFSFIIKDGILFYLLAMLVVILAAFVEAFVFPYF